MTWTSGLIAAVAQRLDDADVGTWAPDTRTPPGSTVSGIIVAGALPAEAESGIGLTPYSLTNRYNSLIADVTQPIQFWLRGTLSYVDDTADAIFTALNGLRDVTLGDVHCVLIELHSDMPQGVDRNGRLERAVNYDFWAMRQTAQTL